tara:strand:+ start:171 stop:2180 length:2010 start_codon:yes stop_codon:yes gene_type:complete
MAEASSTTLSRDDKRKQREIDEARKAGTLPPEVDVESGKLINPHNPEFITKRPWYLGDTGGPSLNHQQRTDGIVETLTVRQTDAIAAAARSFNRASASGTARPTVGQWVEAKFRSKAPHVPGRITKVRANGSCDITFENGKKESSVARRNIRFTGQGMRVHIDKVGKLGWDASRDRWIGYDNTEHKRVVERYEAADAERRRKRVARQDAEARARAAGEGPTATKKRRRGRDDDDDSDDDGSDSDSDSDDSDDDDDDDSDDEVDDLREGEDVDGFNALGGKVTTKIKASVRNLRLREDLPKFLRNLDVNSAYYDPKTRSMRQNPNPDAAPESTTFVGDNYVRHTGDSKSFYESQIFAWEAYARGQGINANADPTAVELMQRQFREKKEKLERDTKQGILDRYGGSEHRKEAPKGLLTGVTEVERRFDPSGRELGIAGDVAVAKTKYEEDAWPGNHTSVWGSWFDTATMQWGFACCFSCSRVSYCTGHAGRKAHVLRQHMTQLAAASAAAPPQGEEGGGGGGAEADGEEEERSAHRGQGDMYGERLNPGELDPEKLRVAIAAQKSGAAMGDPSGGGRQGGGKPPTEEELEAYRMTRLHADDPMRKFIEEERAAVEDAVSDDGGDAEAAAARKRAKKAKKAKKKQKKKEKKEKKRAKKKAKNGGGGESGVAE